MPERGTNCDVGSAEQALREICNVARDDSDWLREQLEAIFGAGGQSALARVMTACGDTRGHGTILRTLSNTTAGRHRMSGEMRALVTVLRKPELIDRLIAGATPERDAGGRIVQRAPASEAAAESPAVIDELSFEWCVMNDLEHEVAARLVAVMDEFCIGGNRALGDLCGATPSAVNNWRLGYNLPRVPEIIRLCEQTGITLDWLYRGFVGAMNPKLAMKLNRRIACTGRAA
jgi:hypothetical protein